MSFIFRNSHPRWLLLLYAAAWTAVLTVTVAVASFTPEIAFVSVIAPTSFFSQACAKPGSVRLPLDIPSDRFCFPARLIKRSTIDMVVPPVFAAVVVVGSACLVKAVGLLEAEDEPL